MNKEKILIAAANSHTGFPAAKELLELGFPVRAFVRNPNKQRAKELKSLGAEIFAGNMNDVRDVRKSMEGINRAYLCQPYAPYSLFTGMTFAVAAEEMKLEHVVSMTQFFSSNTHPSLTTREHWLTDRIVMMSPTVKYTIINPSWAFPFVYLLSLELIAQMGIMPDMGKNALPSNEDMGAVAAHILKDPAKHAGKTYRPTGPKILSTQEMADIIGKILGRKDCGSENVQTNVSKSGQGGRTPNLHVFPGRGLQRGSVQRNHGSKRADQRGEGHRRARSGGF